MLLGDDRQVVMVNLVVATITIAVSFVVMRNYIDQELLLSFRDPVRHLPRFATASGIRLASLPGFLNATSVVVALPFGVADASYKMMRFFTKDVRPPSAERSKHVEGFRSESVILKHLLGAGQSARRGSTQILHLCSAASCIGPYLTHLCAESQEDHEPSISVHALLYGDAVVGNVVGNDLRGLRVRTADLDRSTVVESAMPLHGIVSKSILENEVRARCTIANNSCRYVANEGDNAELSLVPVLSFNRVTFSNMKLSSILFDVVHIDVSPSEALASITYLNGVLSSSSRPTHILLTVYPSPFLEELLDLVNALRGKAAYNVFLSGGRCLAVANVSVLSSVKWLRDLVHDEGFGVLSDVNMRSYFAEPLCVVFLSYVFDSLPNLLGQVVPVPRTNAMEDFVFGRSGSAVGSNESPSDGRSVMNWLLFIVPVIVAGLLIWGFARGRRRLRSSHVSVH
ncbi:hypothetical protein DQ04_16841010 [Trypanosoma grayi]|uniref:hypothetical protein n=1 Tax=Trypanosoma grayi TaxID=71804 RepID=UPI0004F43D7C|nr:hypothetical protein DQ04_16841010 [Trypanosoma grayi]KEG05981.1 hypothetical protein DQ04_16841010 [Trypanosoma grayi]